MTNNSNQPKHTQGELEISKDFSYLDGFYEVLIHYKNGKVFANGIGKTPQEAEANAQRIVKAVNMHDEMLEVLQSTAKYFNKPWTGKGKWAKRLTDQLNNVIKQAELK